MLLITHIALHVCVLAVFVAFSAVSSINISGADILISPDKEFVLT